MAERVQLKNYRRMITKLAWRYYWRLAPQTRQWVGIEDMIQEGWAAARFRILPRYRPENGAFSTFLHTALSNFFCTYVTNTYLMLRRDALSVSFESEHVQRKLSAQTVCVKNHAELSISLSRLIAESSPRLRLEISRWFLERGTKVHTRGCKFVRARDEFCTLADRHGISVHDLIALARHRVLGATLREILKQS